MKTLIVIILLAAMSAMAQVEKQIFDAVDAWPKTVSVGGVTYYNPPVSICVASGKRLKPAAKPATPVGKQIKAETLIQDPDKPEACKWEITYEDAPPVVPPPVIPPEVPVKIDVSKVEFYAFTNSGIINMVWLDAPKTNKVEK